MRWMSMAPASTKFIFNLYIFITYLYNLFNINFLKKFLGNFIEIF